ncbi:MAG: hypothetical protein ACMXYG_05025 [Candidatus Woesearchaeota archaeon]
MMFFYKIGMDYYLHVNSNLNFSVVNERLQEIKALSMRLYPTNSITIESEESLDRLALGLGSNNLEDLLHIVDVTFDLVGIPNSIFAGERYISEILNKYGFSTSKISNGSSVHGFRGHNVIKSDSADFYPFNFDF